MFHTIKRCVSLFILVGLIGSVPILASVVKTEKHRKAGGGITDIQNQSVVALGRKYIARHDVHSYRLNLKQGETVVFTLRSDKPTSLKVQSPSGAVTQGKSERMSKAVLIGAGDYIIEINSENLAFYSVEVTRK